MSEEYNTPEPNQPADDSTPKPDNPAEKPVSQPKQTIVEEIIYEDTEDGGRGCRGCAYGVVGAGGCFIILVILLLGAIAVAFPAVEDALGGIANFVHGETVTRNVTVPIVERIQNLKELKTVRYNFSNIVQSEVEMPTLLESLYGDNIVMVAVGHIEAGIDLAQLTPEDLTVNENTLTITLPAPHILTCYIDEQQSEVVERNQGVFSSTGVELDNAVRRFALEQFLDMALEDGILLDAATEGALTVRQLVEFGLGDDSGVELIFTFAEADPSLSLPETCPR
jgi:hypothetical protein